MRFLFPVLSMLLVMQLSACGSSAKSHFYTLNAPPVPAAHDASHQLSVVLGPISLPEMVDRPQWVLHAGNNQVEISDTHRWAQSPRAEIARVLSANLARDLATPRVALLGQSSGDDADARIALDIVRFETRPGQGTVLEALWTVRIKGHAKPLAGRASFEEAVQGKEYEALAAAHSRALSRLSQAIAQTIRR